MDLNASMIFPLEILALEETPGCPMNWCMLAIKQFGEVVTMSDLPLILQKPNFAHLIQQSAILPVSKDVGRHVSCADL